MNLLLQPLVNWPAQFLAPETMRLMALALLHFLWQGAALAAAAYAAMTLCRTASARYAAGVTALAFMLAAPIATFRFLNANAQRATVAKVRTNAGARFSASRFDCARQAGCAPSAQPVTRSVAQNGAASALTAIAAKAQSFVQRQSTGPDFLLLLVESWFAGVLLLSLRSAGGLLLVERLRRRSSSAIPDHLLELCLDLQDRLRLSRFVRYCKCLHLDAPAVAGWLRPVVLLPAAAISGLTVTQLEAVIAHELAHIRRCDAFVNLFQIAVETLLFYHPAVWWLGKRVRAERENCCDDIAVAVCGSPLTYAEALAHLASSRTAPAFALAANRGPLAARVARLLHSEAPRGLRGTGLSAAVFCLSSALLAGTALIAIAHTVHAAPQEPAPVPAPPAPADKDGAFVIRPSRPPQPAVAATPVATPAPAVAPTPAPGAPASPSLAPTPSAEANPRPVTPSQTPTPAAPATSKSSYLEQMKAAGFDNLSVDELIALKTQGVTPDYVKQMRDLGLHPSADELIGLKVQGITPDYIREMRAVAAGKLDTDSLIGLKVQGVTPDYIKQMKDLGVSTDADDLISLKVQGVTADYIKQMKDLGLRADADNIIGMKVQGVTPDYVKNMRGLGLKIDSDDVIALKVQGVTAEYVKAMQAAGFKLDVEDTIGAKVQGITPEFIEKVRSHGFKSLTLDQLMALKHAGVLDPQQK